jgi:hypothetical protein
MKNLFFAIALISFGFNLLNAQTHKGKCGLDISKAYTQEAFGKNIGYYVEFKNNSNVAIDAIEWKAKFYDNFGVLKGERDGSWSSGNFISPVEPGETTKDLETNWVDKATKVFITIKKVHFTDDRTCK